MDIAVTGSTGLIGTHLVASAGVPTATGCSAWSAPTARAPVATPPRGTRRAGTIDAAALEGIDAVVHLAGVGIADSRWTDEQKRRITRVAHRRAPRCSPRRSQRSTAPPKVLLSGSAIGYYGDHGDDVIDETTGAGDDFPARVCVKWEAAPQPLRSAGIRVAFLRTGIVQSTDGGALAKQLPFFKLGLGGKVGSGTQYISWISIARRGPGHPVPARPRGARTGEPGRTGAGHQRGVHQDPRLGPAPADDHPADDRTSAPLRARARRLAAAHQPARACPRCCSTPGSSSPTRSCGGLEDVLADRRPASRDLERGRCTWSVAFVAPTRRGSGWWTLSARGVDGPTDEPGEPDE